MCALRQRKGLVEPVILAYVTSFYLRYWRRGAVPKNTESGESLRRSHKLFYVTSRQPNVVDVCALRQRKGLVEPVILAYGTSFYHHYWRRGAVPSTVSLALLPLDTGRGPGQADGRRARASHVTSRVNVTSS